MDARLPAAIVLCVSLVSCQQDSGLRAPCEPSTPGLIDSKAPLHQYVVDSIRFPLSASEATQYGQNLDGDELGRVDNAFGQILAAVFGFFDSDLNATVVELVRNARIIHVIQLRATDLINADGVGFRIFNAVDADTDPTNNLGGVGEFVVDGAATAVELAGVIEERHLTANLGSVPLQILFSEQADPVVMMLHAATIDITLADDGTMAGLLGGMFTKAQIDDELMPIVHALLADMVTRDCAGTIPDCCADGSEGARVVGLFDTNPENCTVSLEEVASSNLVNSLLTPDVDLHDQRGRHNPLCDGEKEGLSLGLWFTAVPASF